jgi:hypothetical protein
MQSMALYMYRDDVADHKQNGLESKARRRQQINRAFHPSVVVFRAAFGAALSLIRPTENQNKQDAKEREHTMVLFFFVRDWEGGYRGSWMN